MRWRWWRKPEPPVATVDPARAERNVERARQQLEDAHGRDAEVRAVARSLKRHREQNRFSSLIADTMRGNGGS